MAAVRQNGFALKYIREQTAEICHTALQNNPHALKYVLHKTDDLCLQALCLDGTTLQYIYKPTQQMYKVAVKSRPEAINIFKAQVTKY